MANWRKGSNYVEDNRGRILDGIKGPQAKERKALFLYNTACAYSRAFEQVQKQAELPDRDSLAEKYRTQAIGDLTESFKKGFDDAAYAAKDPDFKILYDDPDFKKILASKSNEKNDKPEEKPERDDE